MSRYLITGHTGFKGSWLALLLTRLGHEVSGIALDPEPRSLFSTAGLHALHTHDIRLDIRDSAALEAAVARVQPDVVIHLAAQPLVRRSFTAPRETVETNAVGTMNLLSAIRGHSGVKAVLIATTDKVYRPAAVGVASQESDPLGGEDIYSASKAMADILTSAWVQSFNSPPTAIARAGNVIGGGDYGEERLIPDLVSAFAEQRSPKLRYPDAVRPWQHVLDCLGGYLTIVGDLERRCSTGAVEAWNVGPDAATYASVADLTTRAALAWGTDSAWTSDSSDQPTENQWLTLNTDKIRSDLEWRDSLDLNTSVEWTINWYRDVLAGADPGEVSREQIEMFLSLGNLEGAACVTPGSCLPGQR
mgnify:CR=1 FL=1